VNAPRPFRLFERVPPGARTALVWLAAIVFAAVVYSTLPSAGHDFPHGYAGLGIVTALPAAVLLRRRPLPVLAVLLTEALSFAAAEHGDGQIALLQFLAADVALCFIAVTRARKTSAVAAVLVLGVVVTFSVAPVLFGHSGFDTAPACALALTVIVAWTIGDSIRQRLTYTETLHAQSAAQAVVAERLRIARELHDMVAHSVGIIAFQAGAASRVIDTQPSEARNALSAIEATSRETLTGLRRMLGALRQAESDTVDTAPTPGLADLDRLAATTAHAGVDVDVTWRGTRRPLPAEIDLSAFRIIQEAVTNVVRHARSPTCEVSVDYRDRYELRIEVLDNGPGRPPGAPGFGIAGMRERVNLLHGYFDAGPRPEGGFRVAARLPA
jgi:signal transduction histidine kinase